MLHSIRIGIIGVLSGLLLTACTQENSFIAEPEIEEPQVRIYPDVDEALWPYFERFEEEAANRGLFIDLIESNITGVIEDLEEDNVLGQCSYNSHLPEHITIDKAFWNAAGAWAREFVVFHELGHCELLRDHFEGQFSDGTCVSLMRSGLEDCRDNYGSATRAGYLDELFDEDKAGDWAF